MNYLTRDDVLDLHAFALQRYGGMFGIKSQDRLLSIVQAPQQTMFGTELYPDLPSKTAAATFLLLKSRPFIGANETTALLVLLRMLMINNARLRPEVGDMQLAGILHDVNASVVDRNGLENWLRDHVCPLS